MTKVYSIKAPVWLHPGEVAWYFVSIPPTDADNIDFYFAHAKRGWGSLRVTVTVGETIWKTSIFPNKKTGSYLLPLKADVRKKEKINTGDTIAFSLEIKD